MIYHPVIERANRKHPKIQVLYDSVYDIGPRPFKEHKKQTIHLKNSHSGMDEHTRKKRRLTMAYMLAMKTWIDAHQWTLFY